VRITVSVILWNLFFSFSTHYMYTLVVFAQRASSSSLIVRHKRLSTELFRLLLRLPHPSPLVSGTNYHATSRLHRLCAFSGNRLKIHLFCRFFPTFYSAREATCLIIGHFNRFCYLLTYLHTYQANSAFHRSGVGKWVVVPRLWITGVETIKRQTRAAYVYIVLYRVLFIFYWS